MLEGEADQQAGDPDLSEDELFERLRTEFDAEEYVPDPEQPDEAEAKEA